MLEHHLNSPITRRRLRAGPAAEHVDGFADWLHHRGYTPLSMVAILRSLAGWTDWMQSAGFSVHDCVAGVAACATELQT
jgi:integrase/recombinase XerD